MDATFAQSGAKTHSSPNLNRLFRNVSLKEIRWILRENL